MCHALRVSERGVDPRGRRGIFGKNPWGHGLTSENQVVLEKFVQYANEQGYIPSRPSLTELFAPVGN